MVSYYKKRIDLGVMTVEDVPVLWREKVRKALENKSNN